MITAAEGLGTTPAGRGAGLGARPARASSRRSWAPAPPSSCRPRWTPTACGCPRRSAPRWRTSPRRRSAIPSAGPDAVSAPPPRRPAATRSSPRSAPPGCGRAWASGRRPSCPAAGITSPDDVTADRLLKLPRVGRQRAERLFSSFLAAQPTYEVVEHAGRRRAGGPAGRRRRRRARARTPPAGCATTRGRCSACTGVTLGRRRPAGDRRAVRRRPAGHPPRPGDRRR